MNKSLLLVPGLIFSVYASAVVAASCSPQMDGKRSCLAGETMKCIKKFAPNTKSFKYELDGVNADGQSFSVNSPLFKKTPGYTPMPCSDSNLSRK